MNGAIRDAARDEARRQSRDCEHCQGMGMIHVFHPDYTGSTVVEIEDHDRGVVRVAGRCAAHCVCAYGRWMRERIEPEMQRRIPDYQDCLDGRSFYLADDPTAPEDLRRGGKSYAAMKSELGRRMVIKGANRGEAR